VLPFLIINNILAFIIIGNYVIKILKKNKEQSEKSQEETNRGALNKMMKGATSPAPA